MRLAVWFICFSSVAWTGSALADAATLDAFFNAAVGTWAGSGNVVFTNMGNENGTYPVTVSKSSAPVAANEWSNSLDLTGEPFPSDTETNIIVSGDQLTIATQQFSTVATITAESATELSYKLVHTEANGQVTTTDQTMTFTSPTTMHVVSDVYSGSTLEQHFDYTLTQTAN